MRLNISTALQSFSRALMPSLAAAAILTAHPALADGSLANLIGDGKPWEMYVVKRKASNILVFRPDGKGTISDGLASISVTWRAVADGICIKPQGRTGEICHRLTRTSQGIAASQNGRDVFVLRR
ncbi:hypothetical protein [Hoeflea sp. BAL378]|uniref:hypothetical protein n=1 Tax=Hoeflea sp. BAL378 TaxID=1547437 RepID=UPI001FCB2ADB|nr:hypothetical protein [Hoeflea sp. BAL378]